MLRRRHVLAALGLAAAIPVMVIGSAGAQVFNVDFGNAGSTPSTSYGAAGTHGRWNQVGVLAPYVRQPLVDHNGATTTAKIYMYGGTQVLQHDNPGPTGDDAALMDDMLIGFNDPVDVCIWLENLAVTDYEVVIYGMTPNDPSLTCRVRVDDGTPGPVYVGGAWPGSHTDGVTFRRFVVHAIDGGIAFHSGLYGGYFQSGMNGFQVRPLSTSSVGEIGSPGAESAVDGAIRIAPNPAHRAEEIEFTMPPGAAASGRLAVYDTRGRLVWSRELDGVAPATPIAWDGRGSDGRDLPPGVFMVAWHEAPGAAIVSRLVRIP